MTGFFVENVEYKGIISGNGSITKTGFGNTTKWKFSGNHTGSGAMTISAGILELNANWNGNLTLGNGRTLKVIGNRTVAGVFTNNRNNSNIEFDLVAGPASLTVTGGMAYGGTSNGNITVKANNQGTYNLITAPGVDATKFTLVNTGTWTGGKLRVSGNTLQLAPSQSGIESIETAGIKIWVENYELRIANYENAENDNVAIYSTTGQLIVNTKLSNSNSVNISNIPNGVYIVRIGNYTGKFIKK
jgi:hypothetical protein